METAAEFMTTPTTFPPPLVSVIIVNYNGGPYFLNTVASALSSSVAIELFVVDNGSTDGSIRMLERTFTDEPRLRIIENGENLGFARANNIALRHATGKFLLLLNPDCIVNEDTLQRVVEALRADPQAGMAGCLIRNPDGSEQAGCRRSIPTPWTGLVRSLRLERFFGGGHEGEQVDLLHNPLPAKPVHVEAISGAFMLLRREALEQVGLMDENYFLHCEDLDWCKSFELGGWKILFVPEVEIVHHKGSCSRSRPFFVLWHKHRGMMLFYRKFLSRDYPAPFNLLVILGVWARFAAMLPVELLLRLRSESSDGIVQSLLQSTPAAEMPRLPDLRGRTVLVTGGSGFIGRRLVYALLRQGAVVRVLSRSPKRLQGTWPQGRVDFVQGDLETPESLKGACNGVHTLFHLASCTHMLGPAADDSEHHRQVTEQGTLALLQVAQAAKVACLVFASSVKAMGEENELRLDESSEPAPENAYGRAKLHAEQAVLEGAAGGSMRASVLRLPMVYGPGNKGNLPRMIKAIRRHRFPPPPDVHNRRSMVHVDDAVQAMLLAAVRERANGEVYIVTDGRVYSTREIYRMITMNLGRRPPRWSLPLWSIQYGARVGDLLLRLDIPVPLNSSAVRKLFGSAWYSSEKIREQLGFEPRYDLVRALPEIVTGKESGAESAGRAAPTLSERTV